VRSSRGVTLIESVVAISLLAILAAVALPALARLGGSARTGAAARHLVSQFRSVRWMSIARARSHGLFFERDRDGWFWIVVQDGNGNGLRAAEVRSGTDHRLSGPHRLSDEIPRTDLGFPAGGPFRRIPPARGWIGSTDDPVRLGGTDLLAFSPLGTASSGSIYVTDGRAGLIAIVLYGRTGRISVWQHDPERRSWSR
jgi:prepilin-type N-terminal cleavage/methylation domain-containing protein